MKTIKLPNGGELREHHNGDKFWRLNNERHREGGPAVECADGTKFWYVNGKLHREDGPAWELANGIKYWFLYGRHIPCETQKQFEQLMRLKAFW